jgi:hypothetical protein
MASFNDGLAVNNAIQTVLNAITASGINKTDSRIQTLLSNYSAAYQVWAPGTGSSSDNDKYIAAASALTNYAGANYNLVNGAYVKKPPFNAIPFVIAGLAVVAGIFFLKRKK